MSQSLAGLEALGTLEASPYALGGMAPRLALRPGSAADVAAALQVADRDGLAVVPWGGGTLLDRTRAPERYDLALDLSGLDRIVEYDPEDLTLTAQCGVTLERLAATVGAKGQIVPLESAHPGSATLGGVLAANTSGPRRLRLGAPRDRILGARFALADGTVARSGGKVVKNVAGFAIHRLLCGSRGGLAVLLEASIRLLTAPEAQTALVYQASREQIADAARWSFLPGLEPAFVTVLGANPSGPASTSGDAPFAVVIGLEDDTAWVKEQDRRIVAALGAPVARLHNQDVAPLAQSLADAGHADAPRITFASPHNTPAALGPLLGHPEATRLVFHAPAGRLHWFPDDEDSSTLVRTLFSAGFTPIEAAGGAAFEPAIPPEAGIQSLRRRLREALDPHRTFALGFDLH